MLSSIVRLLPRRALGYWGEGTDSPLRNLAERLGYDEDASLLIINCDDLGVSKSANSAIEKAMRGGGASSASLMVPCPWAKEAATACRDLDVGVHLTLTSEYPTYRWSSLTGLASLHDRDGYLPKTAAEVWTHAGLDDVERECRAQIDRAMEWGVDITHLDSHMDTLEHGQANFGILSKLGSAYGLPVRLRRSAFELPFSAISRAALARENVVTTDRFQAPPWGTPSSGMLEKFMANPLAGVTEFSVHPVDDGPNLRSYDSDYANLRAADAAFVNDPNFPASLASKNIHLIGFRALRDLMRSD